MGVFDYVRLSEDLKERLGRYGEEDYQTKYGLEEGYVSVYKLFDEYAPAWRLMTWVELLLEPGPGAEVMEPLLQTVDIGDIGTVRRARVEVSLSTCLYEDNINDVLRGLGFDGPEEVEELAFRNRREVLGNIVIADGEAVLRVLRIDRVPADNELVGSRLVLRIRSGDAELSIPLSAKLEIGGREITAVKEELVEKKIPLKVWRKNLKIGSVEVPVKVEVVRDALTPPYTAKVSAEAEAAIEEVDEALIEHLKSEIKEIALSLILGKPNSTD